MSNGGLAKATAKTAAEVCKLFPLGDDAKKLLRDGLAPRPFLDALLEKQQFPDAVRFCACAAEAGSGMVGVPVRPPGTRGQSAGADRPALAAAEKWVSDPSEEHRRAAQAAATAAGMGAPAGCAAMAAFFSGGSLAPPNAPVVPPGEHLTAHAAAGAVMLAAVLTEPQKAAEKYRKFFALGVDVGNGVNKWK